MKTGGLASKLLSVVKLRQGKRSGQVHGGFN